MATQLLCVEVIRNAVHFSPMATVVVNAQGEIVEGNGPAQALFGCSDDGLAGQPISRFIPNWPGEQALTEKFRIAGPAKLLPVGSGLILRGRRKDETAMTLDIGLQELVTDRGQVVVCALSDITDQQDAYIALRDSHERVRHVVDSALDAIITMDREGCITGWNPQAEATFGWSAAEAVNQPLAQLIIPERFRELHWAGLKHYLATGEGPALNRHLVLRALRRNGEEFPIELTISPLRLSAEIEFSAFLRDLSTQVQSETARRQSEEQLNSVFHLASVGMVRIDAKTARFIEVNQRYADLTGYRVDELKTMTPAELTHPDDQDFDQQLIQQLLRQESPEYFNVKRYIRKDGQTIWVEISGALTRDAEGQPTGIIAVVYEVTERKRAETALRQSEERLQQAVSVANFGIFEHDHLTDEIRFSQRMRDAWEWPESDAITIPGILQRIHPDDRNRIASAIQQAHDPAGDGKYEVEHRLLLSSGSTRWIRLRGKTFFDGVGPDRHPVRTIGAGLDITAEKQREAELESLTQQLDQKVRARTQELTQANENLKEAHEALARTAARLAMPARNRSKERRNYILEEFSLADMMDCGTVIRSLSSLPTKKHFTSALVRYLYDHIVGRNGERAFALVRLYESRPYQQLLPEVRKAARERWPDIQHDDPCLTLLSTAGDDPAWNDVRQSLNHQVIPMTDENTLQKLPLIQKLLQYLNSSDLANVDAASVGMEQQAGILHFPEVVGHSDIAAQQSFIVPHKIQSILGFGERMPDGRIFALMLFSHVPIPAQTAALISHLSLSIRLSLLSHIHVPDKIEAQILSLDRLLANHERIVADTEAHLRQTLTQLAASNAELEQFAYVASHDLQEPLRKIQAFSDLLVGGHREELNDEGRDYLDRMSRAADRMQRLINDLLTLSRITRKGLPFTPTNLNDILAAVLMDLETRIEQSGGTVTTGTLPVIDADPTQMGQLFQNLISNGLKYAQPGVPPRVRIEAAKIRPPNSVDRQLASIWWRLTVRDNGIGFDPLHADRIFQPFQRLHGRGEYEGTGIGLTICRRIVERHRGIIEAQGVPGQGAVFTVILPATHRNGD